MASSARPPRPAAFLDRDGVLNVDDGYSHKPETLTVMRGAADAVRLLNEAGYYVFVVTNQSGVARGYYGLDDVDRFNGHLRDRLAADGGHIDAFYVCPHFPDGAVKEFAIVCRCRKPGPGLLEQAASEWPIERSGSFLIGDKDSDLMAAKAFGVAGIKFSPETDSLPDIVRAQIARRSL